MSVMPVSFIKSVRLSDALCLCQSYEASSAVSVSVDVRLVPRLQLWAALVLVHVAVSVLPVLLNENV